MQDVVPSVVLAPPGTRSWGAVIRVRVNVNTALRYGEENPHPSYLFFRPPVSDIMKNRGLVATPKQIDHNKNTWKFGKFDTVESKNG